MSEQVTARPLAMTLDFISAPPVCVDRGARFTLLVAVPAVEDLDLSALCYDVMSDGCVVASGQFGAIEIMDPNPDLYDPREGKVDLRPRIRVTLTAPKQLGSFEWQLVIPAQVIGDVEITSAPLPFSLTTADHRTSLAAWDVPSPVNAGERFLIKVGAKCSAGCGLHGLRLDASGAATGTAALGATCWPEAEGLYWCEMELEAPISEGMHEIALHFEPQGLGLAHASASTHVSFMVTPPAAHRVTICVTEAESGLPIADAQVRFGPHRKATGDDGRATFDVASGTHRLFIWKAHHDFEETTHEVQADAEIAVSGKELPKPNPYARWEG